METQVSEIASRRSRAHFTPSTHADTVGHAGQFVVRDAETGEQLTLRTVAALQPICRRKFLRNARGTVVPATHSGTLSASCAAALCPFASLLTIGDHGPTCSARSASALPNEAAVAPPACMPRESLLASQCNGVSLGFDALAELTTLRSQQRKQAATAALREREHELTRRAVLEAEPSAWRKKLLVESHSEQRTVALATVDAMRLECEVALLQRARTLGALPLPAS